MRQGGVTVPRLGAGLVALGMLAGCSGGGGGNGGPDGPRTFADADEAEEASAVFAIEGQDEVDLPTTGTARYNGWVQMDVGDPAADPMAMIGDLALDVDFSDAGAGDPLSGTVSDFIDEDDQRLDGSLTVSDGSLDRRIENPGLALALGGTLTEEDGSTLEVEGTGAGEFNIGNRAVLGELSGVVRTDGEPEVFEGRFSGWK